MSEFAISPSSEYPTGEKKSRVTNIREVTKNNQTPKSKTRKRLDSLKKDSSLYQQNEASGMSMYELNEETKKLQDEYFKNLNLDQNQNGGRKRKSLKRKKNKKSHKSKRKNKKTNRRRTLRKSSRRRR